MAHEPHELAAEIEHLAPYPPEACDEVGGCHVMKPLPTGAFGKFKAIALRVDPERDDESVKDAYNEMVLAMSRVPEVRLVAEGCFHSVHGPITLSLN